MHYISTGKHCSRWFQTEERVRWHSTWQIHTHTLGCSPQPSPHQHQTCFLVSYSSLRHLWWACELLPAPSLENSSGMVMWRELHDLFLSQVAYLRPPKLDLFLGRAESSTTKKVKVFPFVSLAQPKLTPPPASDQIWPPDHAPGAGAPTLSFAPNSLDAVLSTPR